MRINYFDLGACRGIEIHWVVNHIMPQLGIEDYKVYGFEACQQYSKWLSETYNFNSKVSIINKAISDDNVGDNGFGGSRDIDRRERGVYDSLFYLLSPKGFESRPLGSQTSNFISDEQLQFFRLP